MYVDREQGVRIPRRTPSAPLAAVQVTAARAPLDPEVLRRWRGPAPAEAPAADVTEPAARDEAPKVAPSAPDSPAAAPADVPPAPAPRLRASRKFAIIAIVFAIMAAGAGWFGYRWWTVGRFMVSTDDAYVRADNTTLAAKVPGYVTSVAVADNSFVHAGDVIATLDDGDYRLAADSARQKVATQQATVDRFARQVVAQRANVEQAKAQVVSAQAGATRAQLEFDRQQALAAKAFASKQALEQAVANRDQAGAGVANAQAAVDAAQANVDVLNAQQQEAARTLDELRTAQAKAERDFSFTTVRAPIDGVIGNRAMQVGDFVQTGQRLASVVPLDAVYIDANFKETQLARLLPGQQVAISVDALPGRAIQGTVTSVSPASGSVFSLLPADNATGNFTKIVQRLPVRIRVRCSMSPASEQLLRPGMSRSWSASATSTQRAAGQGLPVLARRDGTR